MMGENYCLNKLKYNSNDIQRDVQKLGIISEYTEK